MTYKYASEIDTDSNGTVSPAGGALDLSCHRQREFHTAAARPALAESLGQWPRHRTQRQGEGHRTSQAGQAIGAPRSRQDRRRCRGQRIGSSKPQRRPDHASRATRFKQARSLCCRCRRCAIVASAGSRPSAKPSLRRCRWEPSDISAPTCPASC